MRFQLVGLPHSATAKMPILILFMLLLSSAMCGQQKGLSTAGMECSDVKAGRAVTQRTATLDINATSIKAFATVQLRRPADDTEASACIVTYKLFVAKDDGQFSSVKQFSEQAGGSVGAEMIGVSKNQKMIAADFWWSIGDATGHTPVIYNATAKAAQLRALHDEIIKQLPSCDYFEEFIGVTDTGEAVIRVPKSIYVQDGCNAQGKWLFDLRTGNVKRMKTGSGAPK